MQPVRQLIRLAAATLAGLCIAAATAGGEAPAPSLSQIPLTPGLVMVSALHWPNGDRENVISVVQQTPAAVTYGWTMRERGTDGKTQELEFQRKVRMEDLAKATRLHNVHWVGDKADYPGYTGWSISTAIYDALIGKGEADFMMVTLPLPKDASQAMIGGLMRQTTRLRGTLRLPSRQPRDFPLLHNSARVRAQAMRITGELTGDGRTENVELWVLADRAHPLLLKSVMGQDVWQMVKIEVPQEDPSRGLEQELSKNCRAELSGIYFGFNDARIDSQSQDALADIAQVLKRHAGWKVSIEGYTDDIGTPADNLRLSQARADAVKASLTQRHALSAASLKAVGFGEAQPREANSTLEGRARNRRVELVRDCK